MTFARNAALILCTLAAAGAASAQDLDAAARSAAVEGVARQIETNYVDREVGARMAAALRAHAASGHYDALADGAKLAEALTRDAREVGHDLHVAVRFSPDALPAETEALRLPTPAEVEASRPELARINYGLERVEVLGGNIGYVKLNLFAPPELAGSTYAAAMALVANTDALVVDIRDNGGSISPDSVPFVCTYFFDRPTHLIDLKWSFEPEPRALWTRATVPGERYLDKPLYVLTSRRTFSGAEEFAYDLKNLRRATIVGETTGGGANPGGTRRASEHFEVFVPFGRVTSPVTGTNWEGVGVVPDVAAQANQAVLVARREALAALSAKTSDARRTAELRAARVDVDAALAAFRPTRFELKGFEDAKTVAVAGTFNGWSPDSTKLVRTGGVWSVEVALEPGRHSYKYVVDGRWIVDPSNPVREGRGEYVNSVRTVE